MMTILRMIALGSFLIALPLQAPADIMVMPGEVIEGHAKEEKDCDKCHKKFDKAAQSKLCADCHKEIAKDLAEKRGITAVWTPRKSAGNAIPNTRAARRRLPNLTMANLTTIKPTTR